MKVSSLSLLVLLFSLLGTSCAKLESLGMKPDAYPHKKQQSFFHLNWVKNLDPIHQTGNLPIGYGTPLIHNKVVYFSDKTGLINAYDLESGRVLWSFNEKKQLSGKLGIYKGKLFYSSVSGRVYVRDIKTQNLDYAIDLKAPIEAEPMFHQGRAIFHLRNHQIMALDASTGKILWSYKRAVPYNTTLQRVSVPQAKGSRLFVGFADGHVGGFSLEEGILDWETRITNKNKFIDVDVTPVIINNRLVVSSANGDLKFLSLKTGGQIISVAVTPGHTPRVEGNRLVFGTVDGRFLIVDSNGQIAIDKKISDKGISSVVAWKGGYVAASHDGGLYYLNKSKLEVTESWHLGTDFSTVFGKLVASDGYLAVYSSRNRLYLFK
jgi:outer membrane protein assembly factor BamB